MAQPAEQLKSEDVIKTYRYLRIGMIGAIVLLGVSIGIEASKVGCIQTSISAYYYTPVRAIFVGSLIAIGLSLIVYKGRGSFEDFFLNLAGMLTPVVAVAPTMDVGRCWSVRPISFPRNQDGTVANWVVTNIHNNFYALLLTGAIGLGVAAIIVIAVNLKSEEPDAPNGGRSVVAGTAKMVGRGLVAPVKKGERETRVALFLTAVALLAGLWLVQSWDDFNTRAHGFAAAGAFGFLILAIVANALELWKQRTSKLSWTCLGIAGVMITGGAVISYWRLGNEHTVFWLELWELTLFALYWIVQTKENWNEDVVRGDSGVRVGTLKWADATKGRLTFWDRLDLFGQAVPTKIEELTERVTSRSRRARKFGDPNSWDALIENEVDQVPKTPIVREAERLCKEQSEQSGAWLLSHCYRTFVIGALLGRGLAFDRELLFVASMLHDIGLLESGKQGFDDRLVARYAKGAPCFAVRGAGVADRVASNEGWSEREALAEAISLHLNVRVPRYRGVEAHLLNAGSALDVIRLRERSLPSQIVDIIDTRWPRDDDFCKDIGSAWANESKAHKECRAAFLSKWLFFQRRIERACPPNHASSDTGNVRL